MSSIVKRNAQLMSSAIIDTCRIQKMNFSINIKQRLEFCRIERSKQKIRKKIAICL